MAFMWKSEDLFGGVSPLPPPFFEASSLMSVAAGAAYTSFWSVLPQFPLPISPQNHRCMPPHRTFFYFPWDLLIFIFKCWQLPWRKVCTPCVCWCPCRSKRSQIPQNWLYRQLWAILWVLGTELRTFARAASAVKDRAISPVPYLIPGSCHNHFTHKATSPAQKCFS